MDPVVRTGQSLRRLVDKEALPDEVGGSAHRDRGPICYGGGKRGSLKRGSLVSYLFWHGNGRAGVSSKEAWIAGEQMFS